MEDDLPWYDDYKFVADTGYTDYYYNKPDEVIDYVSARPPFWVRMGFSILLSNSRINALPAFRFH